MGKDKYTRPLGWFFLSKLLSVPITFLTSLAIARMLGPYNWGIVSMASWFAIFFSVVGDLGLGYATIFFIPRLSKGRIKLLVREGLRWKLFLSLLFTAVLIGISDILAQFYNIPEFGLALKIFSIRIPIQMVGDQLYSILNGFREFGRLGMFEILMAFSKFLPLALTLSFFLYGAITGYAIFFLIPTVYALLSVKSLIPRGRMSRDGILKQGLKVGRGKYVSTLLILSITFLPTAYLGVFGAEEVGFFSVSVTMMEVALIFTMVINNFLVPTISKADHDHTNFLKVAEKYGKFILYFQIPIALSFFSFRRELLIFFGGKYLEGSDTLGIMLIATIPYGIFFLFQSLALGIGKSEIVMRAEGLRCILNTLLLFYLVPLLLSRGAALAFLFSLLISLLFIAYPFRDKEFNLELTKRTLASLLSTFLTLTFLSFLLLPVSRPIYRLITLVAVGIPTYLLIMMGIKEVKLEDLKLMKKMFSLS
ncbi:MAG: oligosaccharide flippase family protein [Candidatus Nanoarchaeia archaeon]|nr:oligosaccharide flippase family protein [Candidatus Haiyanarchaeum thermophilum]MCW1303405.1 oligosaccharide flippase family protein [Candidatus Haiyanarchaeum thermophilum]MCW1303908.1 oligosaccharide flippase family protein [Candidatus Haiyanarchaeum thermophilum]MCW1306767.1 oligosaccharide flippase family protein [Candidatus Haiyanarchaeum thermophilum]MCW1307431.1 oligosaccharide flippase family protein [Candidatus Haiyanarchaeum thermophilum]